MASSFNNAQTINFEESNMSQKQNLRLQILLLFYDDRKIDEITEYKNEEVDDNGCTCIVQNGDICTKASFKISGVEIDASEKIETASICIKEKLSGNKKKDKSVLKKYQGLIAQAINSYYFKQEYNEIYVDFLIPKDNDLGVIEAIYELFLLDKEFIDGIKERINLNKSSISILYPEVDKECSSDNLPNAMDAKIAALMSHYVYFYLDWLEYVHVHVAAYNLWNHDLEKYKSYKLEKESNNIEPSEKERVNSIISEFNNLLSPSFGSQIWQVGSGKVKARIVGRLKEIAKIVNYGIKSMNYEDYSDLKRDITKIINSYMNSNADDELLKQYILSAKTENLTNDSTKNQTILQLLKKVLGDSYEETYSQDYRNFLYCELKGKLDDFKKTKVIINLLEDFKNKKGDKYNTKKIQNDIKRLCEAYNKVTKSRVKDIFETIGKKKEKENSKGDDIGHLLKELEKEHKIIFENALLGFINFLHEVAATSVYVDVLLESKREGRPVGFYDLYDKFNYWNHIGDTELMEEAKKWYVSHPYFVFKNDYEQIYSNKDKETNNGIQDDENVPAKKIIKIIPRKTQKIFIYKNKYNKDDNKWIATGDYLIYNTVLTHGMDQASGYGGLLFAKVELDTKEENGILKPLKFAYCTKGTDVNSINDWFFVDILQGVSGFSLQHVHNVKNAITINGKVKELSKNKKNAQNKEIPLFFCGHSLGGGLASAGAIASKGRHAITFNAAGLNFLGVLATRTLGEFNYSFNVPKTVHPIRIDGEAIDVIMIVARVLTGGLNERAYGNPELILKLKRTDKWDISEFGAKHGINNFLYKPLMNALEIVEEGTIKVPNKVTSGQDKVRQDTSIATLGQDSDSITFDTYKVQRKGERGNYIIEFHNIDYSPRFVSVYKYNIQEQINLIKKISTEILAVLKNSLLWESPN